jgi:hypothetical protein
VADQVVRLMHRLHADHQTEDAGLRPLVRRRDPAAAGLPEAMKAEHRAIVPAVEALTDAAQHYRSAPGDAARLELIQELEAMPVVAQALTTRNWDTWNKQANVKGKPLRELGLEGHWLIGEIDPEGYQVVVSQVPAVPRFILLHGFARPYRRRRSAWWSPGAPHGHAAASV